MNKKIFNFFRGIFGILLFVAVQLVWQLIFLDILKSDKFLLANIVFLGGEVVSALIFGFMNRKKLKNDYQDFNLNFKKYLKIGLKAWFIGILVMAVSNAAISSILGKVAENENNLRGLLGNYPIYIIFSTIIFAPFIEELTFRGNFREAFSNNKLFILVTSLLFAGIHVFNGITNPMELLYFIPYGSLAVAFGYTYVKTNNIYTTMVLHSLHNAISIGSLVLLYLVG